MGCKPRKKKDKVLVLRIADQKRQSWSGFQWPEKGLVHCDYWDPEPHCGNGLHGALWGEGNGDLFRWGVDDVWQVVEVDADKVVDLGGKVKFPHGVVLYSGDRKTATEMIQKARPGAAVIGGSMTAGDYGTATAGDSGTATAGDRGTATAGYGGTATAGDRGTATAGDDGTATAGYGGTATAGDRGTATAGDYGQIRILWWDKSRYRLAVGYVGEDDIKVNVKYRCEQGKLIKCR